MLGFAVIDSRGGREVALWLSSRVARLGVEHTNAIVVDRLEDPDALQKVRVLTRDRAVLFTDGSTIDGLPVDGERLAAAELIAALTTDTERHQDRILAALRTWANRPDAKTGRVPKAPRKVVLPDFAPGLASGFNSQQEDTPGGRALATANRIRVVWLDWLGTENERARRAKSHEGEVWLMPEDLREPAIADLPEGVSGRLHVQPLV